MDSNAEVAVAPARSASARILRDPRLWLGGYLILLAAIAFWPAPVDRDAGPLLQAITRLVPWLTYDRIEFGANVLMFVPLGALLAMMLRRRLWVLPVALVVTVGIEVVQGAMLSQRTPAISDVIANVLGAVIGMLAVVLMERLRGRRTGT